MMCSQLQEDDRAAADVEEAMEILHGMQDDDEKMFDELEEQLEKRERAGKPPRRSAAIAADKALDGSKSQPPTVRDGVSWASVNAYLIRKPSYFITAFKGVFRRDAWFPASAARPALDSGGGREKPRVRVVVGRGHPEGLSEEASRHHRQAGRQDQGHRREGP